MLDRLHEVDVYAYNKASASINLTWKPSALAQVAANSTGGGGGGDDEASSGGGGGGGELAAVQTVKLFSPVRVCLTTKKDGPKLTIEARLVPSFLAA